MEFKRFTTAQMLVKGGIRFSAMLIKSYLKTFIGLYNVIVSTPRAGKLVDDM